ncbi:hypothetical protein [Hoeflea sp. IMCC20628]|uniref:hypothetical protein n=1 Tax=Hoeflea sp. IMCC20628 TaxID=1620421 RepID=UPI0012E079A6|nr:hypothetical protein [Hoeflea sp. IMCC20628]
MADTIMAMLIASASVEINMVSPFGSKLSVFSHTTWHRGIGFISDAELLLTGLTAFLAASTLGFCTLSPERHMNGFSRDQAFLSHQGRTVRFCR